MINNNYLSKILKFYRSNNFYWLMTVILGVALVMLSVKIIARYHHDASISSNASKSVVYSIKEGKIISPLVNNTPPSKDVAVAKTSDNTVTTPTTLAPPVEDNLPKIAVLIANVGLSATTIPAIVALPAKVTVGLSPYAPDLESLAKKLLDAKHELMMSMPLEPVNYPEDDAGPYALLTNLDSVDNLERLKYLINKVANIVGVFSMEDEKFTNNNAAITPVIQALKERNLIYAYAGAKNNVAISQTATQENFNLIVVDFTIDQNITDEYISAQLANAIDKAKKNGFATIVCRPYPISVNALTKWLETLEGNKISLTTFADIVNLSNKGKQNATTQQPAASIPQAKPAIP
jgi:polysaccharide deacetylase 2 family uncharacterized protein YibQ